MRLRSLLVRNLFSLRLISKERLLPLKNGNGQTVAMCLELHDTAVSKLMAGRDKGHAFLNEILANRLISLETLAERAALIQQTVHEDALLPRLQKASSKQRLI